MAEKYELDRWAAVVCNGFTAVNVMSSGNVEELGWDYTEMELDPTGTCGLFDGMLLDWDDDTPAERRDHEAYFPDAFTVGARILADDWDRELGNDEVRSRCFAIIEDADQFTDHDTAREDGSAERSRRFRRVGVVAVDHEVAVGIDVAEHLPTDIALALARLILDDSASRAGDLGGAVGRVVVVDVDGRLGKLAAEVIDDLADSQGLVIAGNDDRNTVSNHCLRSLFDIQIDTRRVAGRVRGPRNGDKTVTGIHNLSICNIGRQAEQVLIVDKCCACPIPAAADNHKLVYLGLRSAILNNGHKSAPSRLCFPVS